MLWPAPSPIVQTMVSACIDWHPVSVFRLSTLHAIRAAELELVRRHLVPTGGELLEIGAGTGDQSRRLAESGFTVAAVDVGSSNYRDSQVFPIEEYDGRTLPFADATFDLVFTSNVLEHVEDLATVMGEIERVLRRGGRAVHVLPTPAWRTWTTLTAFPAAPQRSLDALTSGNGSRWRRVLRACLLLGTPFVQRRHGERGNLFSEAWYYRSAWWRAMFDEHGFRVLIDEPVGIYYSGNTVLGTTWSIARRKRMARLLGSACRVYVTAPENRTVAEAPSPLAHE